MERTSFSGLASPGFVADPGSVSRSTGRQIDWDEVPASFVNEVTGKKFIPGGTVMDELASGKIIPRPAGEDTEDQTTIGLLATNANEDASAEALSGYGVITGGRVYTQLLPTAPDAEALTALRALDGGGFAFEDYADDRAS